MRAIVRYGYLIVGMNRLLSSCGRVWLSIGWMTWVSEIVCTVRLLEGRSNGARYQIAGVAATVLGRQVALWSIGYGVMDR